MDKHVLLEKVKKGGYSKDELVKWITCIPGSVGNRKPQVIKAGDVYMHPIFRHPYVFLEKKKGFWICGLLTTDGEFEEILEECRSRFFTDSYFTKVLFTISTPVGSWCNVYDNNRQLKRVTKQLKDIMI